MYSFSTCWNSHRHTDGRAMLREIRDLGFEYAELSHGIRLSLVPGILDAVAAGEIKISTLHNFCPLPIGVEKASPNLYEFSSDKPRDRELALKHTFKTFEFAKRVGAQLVVLHLGSMELKDYGGKLEELLERGEKDSPKYAKLLAEAVAKREAKKKTAVANLYDSLKKIVPEAEKLGLKLGCENREAVQEIPLEPDFANFLRDFPSPAIYYWHDCGHAQIKQNLGFIRHTEFLGTLAPRLGGFHIHDVQFPSRDHCPPGSGDIDYAALKSFVKPEHIKVFELSPRVPTEAAQRGIAHLKSIWGEE
jgi:sugar phosphate isomerase/epimerase